MKECENCGLLHDESYGSGRFCCAKCARGFSTKSKRKEINEKVSKSLKGRSVSIREKKPIRTVTLECKLCDKEFTVKYSKRKQQYCSLLCTRRGNIKKSHEKIKNNPEWWSKIQKDAYASGNNYVAGGTTKWYDYKDIKVQGTYELRTCKILDALKECSEIKNWEYTNDRIEYIGIDEKSHNYLLDFKVFLNDDSFYYLEVKGWQKPNDELKWQAVIDAGYELVVWFEKDISKHEDLVK